MSADNQDVSLYEGDTLNLTIPITDEAGAALDLTGAQLEWVLADSPGSIPLLTKTTASGITVSNPVTGVAVVGITHADSANLGGIYWHQLVVTDAFGDVATVTTGAFTVKVRTP